MGPGRRERYAAAGSVLTHVLVFAALVLGPTGKWFVAKIQATPETEIVFHASNGESAPSGGGDEPNVEEPVPDAPVPPRKPRPLNFDELNAPDLPTEPLFDDVFSPEAVEIPGLPSNVGGVSGVETGVKAVSKSSGTRPGLVSTPGSWDSDPVPIYEPPSPPYPGDAREKMVQGEVILQVLVKLDGSTEVVRVIKSLPFCVEAAKENAKLWRWKPALKDGKPVEALGIITVTFDIFAQKGKKT